MWVFEPITKGEWLVTLYGAIGGAALLGLGSGGSVPPIICGIAAGFFLGVVTVILYKMSGFGRPPQTASYARLQKYAFLAVCGLFLYGLVDGVAKQDWLQFEILLFIFAPFVALSHRLITRILIRPTTEDEDALPENTGESLRHE